MSEPDTFSPHSYDLSEAALKELYRDFEADGADDLTKLIDRASELIGADRKAKLDSKGGVPSNPPNSPAAPPPVAAPVKQAENIRRKARSGSRGGRKLAFVVVALSFGAPIGWLFLHTPGPPLDGPVRQPPVAGVLGVADLADGYTIRPGGGYRVEIPTEQVRIEVVSGRVALLAQDSRSSRPCSDQPFLLEVKRGPAAPLLQSCGASARIQAAIPQPQLPAPARLPGENSAE